MWIYILLGIIVIIGIIDFIITIKKYKLEKKYKEEYIEKQKYYYSKEISELSEDANNLRKEIEILDKQYKATKDNQDAILKDRQKLLDQSLQQMREDKEALEKAFDELKQSQSARLEESLHAYYESLKAEYERTLRATQNSLRQEMATEFEETQSGYQAEINTLEWQIDEYKKKQAAINEQILRQRAIDEQQDFYRICITENDLDDIQTIQSIRQKLHKTAFLDKMCYDAFVAKYVKEMIKRVLINDDQSGIYKVTNIQTNEIYIGKSTSVATRWTNHVKSAFGLEGVADSQFQRALKKYGVQNFTWELLEQVPKEQLSTREKYYIEFYDTLNYGYNQRNG